MEQPRNAAFEATFSAGVTGLVGTVEVAIIDNDGNTVVAAHTTGIIENIVEGIPTGFYTAELTAPGTDGQYSICWSPDGTWNPIGVSCEDLVVGPTPTLSPLPPPSAGGAVSGPCSAWVDAQDVIDCCSGLSEEIGSDLALLDGPIAASSELLYYLSGKRYSGSCGPTVVRPCENIGCNVQVLSRGFVVGWWGDGWGWGENRYGRICGCCGMNRVKLAGYPVREIIEVKIDGVVVPEANNWRLDKRRWLTRIADANGNSQSWPSCQRMDLPDTEDGTFSIEYTYGQDPPWLGQQAAAQLACQVRRQCAGLECDLPAGATRITRQGITIERGLFASWAYDSRLRSWRTGLTMVDAFLTAVNPSGLFRRPNIWSPDAPQYARKLGV